jgi:alkylated DNA repair dioxygenase AlkB
MLPAGFRYQPDFLEAEEADRISASLWSDLDWRQYPITLFGKTHLQPRLVAWCSDPGIGYRYSGTQLAPGAWHPDLAHLRQRLHSELGMEFNSVLLNAYRDGRDAMGWHADDETELGKEPVIASISLGQTRRLLLRPRSGGRSIACELENGSLLVMSGRSQADWLHAVPRTKRWVGLRINLTFRRIVV